MVTNSEIHFHMKSPKLSSKGKSSDIKRVLMREIQRLHSRREPLNLIAVKRCHPELVQRVFSLHPFWGWIQALRDAGIDYDQINTELDEFIDCRICGQSFRQLYKHLKIHGTTAEAYRKEFIAETASETDRASSQKKQRELHQKPGQLPLWDAPWCEEIVLDRMAEYHRNGVSLHYDEIDKRERNLVIRATRYYGSWDEALRKIGMDPAQVRRITVPSGRKYPTANSVLQAIRRRHRKRLPLNRAGILVPRCSPLQRDEALFKRGTFLFGSWDEAIRRAGLPRQRLLRPPCYTTPEAVLEEIQRRHREGMPLSAVALTAGAKKLRDETLYRHGRRLFRSWNRAVAQAGLPPQAVRFLGGRYPTSEAVIREIRRRMRAGLPIHSYQLQMGVNKDIGLLKCGARHFGTWSKALDAAQVASPYRKLGPVILQALQAAGTKGLSVTELAVQIKGNMISVSRWLYVDGKKVAGLQKIAPITFRYTPDDVPATGPG